MPENVDQPSVAIDVVHDASINWALQQNDVPVVKLLRVRNDGREPLEDLVVRIGIASGIATPAVVRVARIAPGATWNLDTVDLALDPEALASQVERESTTLDVTVSIGEEVVARVERPIAVLAWNEWGGVSVLPEIVAAFVQPNHPAIDGILARAQRHLESATGDPSLGGYQSRDAERARAHVAAVFAAIRDLGIGYVNPPASYESEGQKVRLADQILEHRLGTCLDLALLFAACLEQCGLHSLIILVTGHAFVGCWLADETFAEPAVEDAARLRKRIRLDEIAGVEATAVTVGPGMDFEHAQKDALRTLQDTAAFCVAIDVAAARRLKIRPLPSRVIDASGEVGFVTAAPARPEGAAVVSPDHAVPARVAEIEPSPDSEREDQNTRLDRWKRKLLDLSLRNRLINYRDTKKTIPLHRVDLGAFEDALAGGRSFRILPRPDLAVDGPRDLDIHREREHEDALESFLESARAAGRVHAKLTSDELERRLIEVWRTARREMEESGANTLYLALGFLSWFESPASPVERWAPILLVPLQLVRKSARDGYRVCLADDDPRINVTLLEKLRADLGIDDPRLAEIPEDESGVDVELVMRRWREAVKDLDRWDVRDEASIGLFSFTKFLMWRDLQARSEHLLQQPLVRRILEAGPEDEDDPAAAVDEPGFPDPATLDATRQLVDCLCPLDADSSQLAAVYAAADGQSFVLQGPPGTGKSQTITNLISHTLGHGKRVLFVAEKMAALEVVHRRLERIGLAPFCLEVHSNKASKRDVLDQCGDALEYVGTREPADWVDLSERLQESRTELNAYVKAIHGERPLGMSVFDVTAALIGLREAPRVTLGLAHVGATDASRRAELREHVGAMKAAMPDAGAANPLAAVGCDEWTTRLADDVVHETEALEAAVVQLEGGLAPVSEGFEISDAAALSEERLRALGRLAALLHRVPGVTRDLLTEPGWNELRSALSEDTVRGRARDAARNQLLERYDRDLLRLDLPDLIQRLRRANEAFILVRAFSRWQVRRAVRPHTTGRIPTSETLLADLEAALAVREENRALAAPPSGAARVFGHAWASGEADWAALDEILEWAGGFRTSLLALSPDDPGVAVATSTRAVGFATDHRDQVSDAAPFGRRLREFGRCLDHYQDRRRHLRELLTLDETAAYGATNREGVLLKVREACSSLRDHRDGLRSWCHWRRVRDAASTAGLDAIATALEHGRVSPDAVETTFERSFLEDWLNEITDADALLRRFNSAEHGRRIESFRRLDCQHMKLTQALVAARLAARVPAARGDASPTSETGILQRQLKLKRRHMPVRQLVGRLPNLLPRLKPCFLASPLSVAQYLDPTYPPFDLVVFDEASQIPPWDAIGAMARGAQVVVVGDSKQLPPTSFFRRQDDDEWDEDDLEEVESVLDECEASGLGATRLLWHYRSRHESLITFSNWHYYDNGLFTFPAAAREVEGLGVSHRYIKGVYDRSQTRTNRHEAEAVVDEITERLVAPGDPDAKPTIGVVAFSMAQQTLIEDLLDARRRKHPEMETYFSDARDEPLFVKNLENVQGDERDLILFSVCYGPDATGRVSMNFGPVNREGGERRLNVAITRARRQVIVFSSLRPEQIDLSRTRSVGVKHLRTFLDYSARGADAIAEAILPHDVDTAATSLEADVADAVRAHGYEVDLRVGCSAYRIDLAVRDPNVPGEWILGVECDGPSYHGAPAARDRDRIRPSVLQSLGWRLHRIWSSDWWHDRATEVQKLGDAIRAAMGAKPAPVPPQDGPDSEPDQSGSGDPRSREEPTPLPPAGPAPDLGSADDFYAAAKLSTVAARLAEIIAEEAPIHLDRVARRIARSFSITRLTTKVRDRVLEVLATLPAPAPTRIDDFLWLPTQDPADHAHFRPSDPADPEPREAEEIPMEELANATLFILQHQISLPTEALAKELARIFGFSRLGKKLEARMREGIAHAVVRGSA
ncbi:MAG: hypothetical protein CMJ83_05635, partial [Planctomycetes bacterium]|nr:hypothetical protein [Planctomycetota bacterium]